MSSEVSVLQPDCYKRHAEIESHLKEGAGWRTAIISLVIAMIIQIGTFLTLWGRITQMVEINTKRLDRAETVLFIK